MKLLITTFTYAPQANGVAVCATEQAEGLARRGHEVLVATGGDPARGLPAGTNPRIEPFEVRQGRDVDQAEGPDQERFRQFIRDFRGDAILCHCWQCWPTQLALEAFPGQPAKKVMVSHGFGAHLWQPHPKPWWGLGQWLRGRRYVRRLPAMLRAFDHLLFLSAQVDRQRFYDHWVRARSGGPPWSAIPNGTWPAPGGGEGPAFRARHGLGAACLFLCVGNYAAAKNQAGALRAFLAADLEAAALVFIGGTLDDYARQCQALAAAHQRAGAKGRVLFLDQQSRADIRAAYDACDVVVLASKGETQPLALLDAMACGKPFVSTEVGCVREFPGGLVVRSERELGEQLRRLRLDPALRQALGQRGAAACRTVYHWDRVLDAQEALLQRLVAGSPGTSG